jgi:hypothetical protein
MPDLTQAIRGRVVEIEADAKAERDRLEAEKNAPLFAELARLDKLAQSDDFRWFVETYLAPIVAREEKALKDVKRSKDERDNSCHRLHIAEEIAGKLEAERTQLANKLYPKK